MDTTDIIFSTIIIILITGCCIYLGAEVLNTYETIPDYAIVVEKHYIPAHNNIVMTYSGKIMIPVTQFYPDSFEIVFKWDDDYTWRIVNKRQYDAIDIGMNYTQVTSICSEEI